MLDISNQNLKTITGNPFNSIPQHLVLRRTATGIQLASIHFSDGNDSSTDLQLSGSAVTHSAVPDAMSIVAPTGAKNANTGRLLLASRVPDGTPINQTWEFALDPTAAPGAAGRMSLNIAQKLYHPMNELGDHLSIPLLVGPSSVTLAGKPIQKSVGDPAQLDLDWNSIFSTAKKVLPVVASAGYDIYKELSGNKIDAAQDPEGFLDTLSSIAKVAVPIAGTILSVL